MTGNDCRRAVVLKIISCKANIRYLAQSLTYSKQSKKLLDRACSASQIQSHTTLPHCSLLFGHSGLFSLEEPSSSPTSEAPVLAFPLCLEYLTLPQPLPHVWFFLILPVSASIFKEHSKVVKGMDSGFQFTYWLCDLGQVTPLHPSFFSCKVE